MIYLHIYLVVALFFGAITCLFMDEIEADLATIGLNMVLWPIVVLSIVYFLIELIISPEKG
jgi:hypothetical protein